MYAAKCGHRPVGYAPAGVPGFRLRAGGVAGRAHVMTVILR
jgi:hypothetical protein